MTTIAPQKLTDIEIAFSTDVSQLMPKYEEIPKEFKNDHNPWVEMVHEWFYDGLQKSKFAAKPGIDSSTAFRHLEAVMRSFDPKHEHKIAAVAFLMAQWFDLAEKLAKKKQKVKGN